MRWTRWAVVAIAAAALGCDGEMDRMAGGEQGDGDSPGTPLDDGGQVLDLGLDAAIDAGPTLDGGDGAADGGDGAVDGGDGATDGGDGAVDGGDGAMDAGDGGPSEAGTDARTM